MSQTSSRKLIGAWDPEINVRNNQIYEPLIDQATKIVGESTSRKLRFRGTPLTRKSLIVVETRGELKRGKIGFKLILA